MGKKSFHQKSKKLELAIEKFSKAKSNYYQKERGRKDFDIYFHLSMDEIEENMKDALNRIREKELKEKVDEQLVNELFQNKINDPK